MRYVETHIKIRASGGFVVMKIPKPSLDQTVNGEKKELPDRPIMELRTYFRD